MRAITKKGVGGYHLVQAHQKPPTTSATAASRWSSFGHKTEVLNALLDEQYYLCCYSELRPDEQGFGYHIEHIENKHQNPERTFDYSNLAASALHSHDLQMFQGAVFGGHATGKQGRHSPVDMNRFISCHTPDCSRYFSYVLEDGRIIPSHTLNAIEKDRAQYTIDTLNLNSHYLVAERKKWFEELDDCYQEHIENGWNIEYLARVYFMPCNNKINRFFSITRQFFGKLAEQTLQDHYPALR